MIIEVFLLFFSLGLILLCAEFFTNAVEYIGTKLSLSQAVVGNLIAAVGTALPETIIPIVAIIFHKGKGGEEIGIGAIIGAPFMLITMGMFLVGSGILCGNLLKTRKYVLPVEKNIFIKDMKFFLFSFGLAVLCAKIFPENKMLHYVVGFILLINYAFYVISTFKTTSAKMQSKQELYLLKIFNFFKFPTVLMKFGIFWGIFQTVLSLLIMVKGAHIFVGSLKKIALTLGFDPLLFALIVAPVATELPEKFNSFLWSLRGKDILAVGNITGAMVFQSTFPVTIGLWFTSWKISSFALISCYMALLLALVYAFLICVYKKIPLPMLLLSGILYIVYGILVFFNI